MLIYIDGYGHLRALGARIDTNIGVIFTDGTRAREIRTSDVFTLTSVGDGIYTDGYGRRFYETDSSYVGRGAGSVSVSTRGDAVVRVGRAEINYIGDKVTKIDGVELHYMGDKLTYIGGVSLHYTGDRLTRIGNASLSYTGERVTKIGYKYI